MQRSEFDHRAMRDFASYLRGDGTKAHSYAVYRQLVEHGCARDGFTGALAPLEGSMTMLVGVAVEAWQVLDARVVDLADGLDDAADEYANAESSNAQGFNDVKGLPQ